MGTSHRQVFWQHVLLFIRMCIGQINHCNASGHRHADSQASEEDAAGVLQKHVHCFVVNLSAVHGGIWA